MMYRKIMTVLCCFLLFYDGVVVGIQTPFPGGMFASIQKKHLSDAWYSSKKTSLLQQLKDLSVVARKKFSFHVDPSSIRAIVVPHNGYDYSGAVATSVYQCLKPGIFNRIIIIAPSHHVAFEGVALPGSQYNEFKSPLGLISFDQRFMKKLKKMSPVFEHRHHVHELEHAVEVQIPLIQYYCDSCSIVPLIVGSVSDEQIETIANCLASIIDQKTLVVISSDFTHHGALFGYQPFKKDILFNIFKLDSSLVQALQNHDLKTFKNILDETGDTVCGKYPLMILLSILQKKCFVSNTLDNVESYVVGYDTSCAPHEKNPEHCVSYVGMIFSTQLKKDAELDNQLTGYEKQFLLQLGRKALDVAVTLKTKKLPKGKMYEQYIPGILTKTLQEKQAAFVTLYVGYDKKLRGCIGTTHARVPLYQEVWDMAISAALHDTRFNPIEVSELPKISLEISVLTKPEVVHSIENICLGTDGIMLHNGPHFAVYLPEVATDQGWNLEQTLASLSQKAGLDIDAWKDKYTTFERFQTIHIMQ